jgi:starch phosphorylase
MKNITSEEGSNENKDHTRTSITVKGLQRAYQDNLFYALGRYPEVASAHDLYMAAALTVRDRMLGRWIKSARTYQQAEARTVCYFSAEYLLGPHLANNLINLDIMEPAREAATKLDLNFKDIVLEQEEEPGLGNGGLGRLAACFMDSLATSQIPAIGYGIRYEFGIFDQLIENGWQVEVSDLWLRNGNPWELARPDLRFMVCFGGNTEHHYVDGKLKVKWIPELIVNGVAYDTPILGYGVENANLLRLWKSEAPKSFDVQAFNTGDYYGAVNAKVDAENITKVLYPNDEPKAGKELRLKQQYFFVSCSLQDMIRLHLNSGKTLDSFHHKYAAQLNDTHPAIAVAELMRLLIDEYTMDWAVAWNITCHTFSFTNHTLLPEALETWSVALFKRLLPRHLEIIYEINKQFLDELRIRFMGDESVISRLSIIDESGEKRVRMAHLATVGSYAVNGVAALHTELLKSTVMKDFNNLWPDKFHNITNGVTPRRFMVVSNPRLTKLISGACNSDEWVRNLSCLQKIEPYADESSFQEQWQQVKIAAKQDLSNWMAKNVGVKLDPQTLFDVQAKRFHEYKRQHLNLLHIITLYLRLKSNPQMEMTPRTFIFAGKAAPGYYMAKLIIKLINSVAEVFNRDPQVNGFLKVVFLPNFNVKNGQKLYPAADLSEQISQAGKEASGTGNMKFSMNGALTIGTLDGANVEIREEVGAENFFLFGLNSDQVREQQMHGYQPEQFYKNNLELGNVIDLIDSGLFSHGDTELFRPLTDNLKYHDPFMVLADYEAYIECQQEVNHAFLDRAHWNRMSILNVARMGKFSSDRSIEDYCSRIWKVKATPVKV